MSRSQTGQSSTLQKIKKIFVIESCSCRPVAYWTIRCCQRFFLPSIDDNPRCLASHVRSRWSPTRKEWKNNLAPGLWGALFIERVHTMRIFREEKTVTICLCHRITNLHVRTGLTRHQKGLITSYPKGLTKQGPRGVCHNGPHAKYLASPCDTLLRWVIPCDTKTYHT